MKKIMCLLLLSAMLCACSSSTDTKDDISVESTEVSKKDSDEESKADGQNMFSETDEDGIRLELVEVSGE